MSADQLPEDAGSEDDFHSATSGSNGGQVVTASISVSINPNTASLPNDNRSDRSSALRATTPLHPENPDLARRIKGMYRVLDLIVEQGSGGLVDKIIISQDGVQEFIDDLYPGAYTSMTRIDFKALDKLLIKPIGIYGSKSELVRFLGTLDAIDEEIAHRLLDGNKSTYGGEDGLRSGLYFVRSPDQGCNVFVVYWPEDTTWDDDAISSVRRNRVTLMRYLTKLADQVVALISDAHAERLVWKEAASVDEDASSDEDESDRLFTFQVSKTVAQEESVTARTGFFMSLPAGVDVRPSPQAAPDGTFHRAQLIRGETSQGLIVPILKEQRVESEAWQRRQGPMSSVTVQGVLDKADQLVLSESLDTPALRGLFACGLSKRFPTLYGEWQSSVEALQKKYAQDKRHLFDEIKSRVAAHQDQLQETIKDSYVKSIVATYPFVSAMELGGERYRGWGMEKSVQPYSSGTRDQLWRGSSEDVERTRPVGPSRIRVQLHQGAISDRVAHFTRTTGPS
ncbi:hypothetical protein PENSPDRAFT_665019 [Peniophora sp. CONT]|nr:hypothetical protein PENSPDRAFT_665019 [Peniophora sp. CONT]